MASDYARGAGPGDAMISDLDLYRAAAILVKRYGEDATVEAAMLRRCNAGVRRPGGLRGKLKLREQAATAGRCPLSC